MLSHISVPILILPSHCGVPYNCLPTLHPNNTARLSSVAPVVSAVCRVHCSPYLVAVWWPLLSCLLLCTATSCGITRGTGPSLTAAVTTSVLILMLCNLCSWCSIVSVDFLQIARHCTPVCSTHWLWCPFIADELWPHKVYCMLTLSDDIKCWGEM